MKARKKTRKTVPAKAGKGSLISQLEYERRRLVAADNTISQLREDAIKDGTEMLRLNTRSAELEELLREAAVRLEAEISAHEVTRTSLETCQRALDRSNKSVTDLEAELAKLKEALVTQKAVSAFTRSEALRVIRNYRRAGALLGVIHVMEVSAPIAHRGIIEVAENFDFDQHEVSVPLMEMLRSASRHYEAVTMPATDAHLWPFTHIGMKVVKKERKPRQRRRSS